MNADPAVLRARYGELTPLDAAPEGSRYAATLPDGTPVVVVTLNPVIAEAIRDRDAFVQHLRRVGSIRHAEISRVVSWGCDDGLFHCGYERADARAADPGSHASMDVAMIGVRLGRALHAAHRNGIAHGSITTAHVSIASDGAPRLMACGLVPAVIAGGVRPRTAYAEMCDSLYLSPEQQAGEAPSARSDVYALGAMLYELLTGKAPFGGRTTSYVMATVLPDEPTSGADQRTNADIVIHALLRAIEHEPDDRWPHARALADALAAAAPSEASDPGPRGTSAALRGLRARFAAIFEGAWFPAGRSRE